jgi:hypothetical protein
MIVTMLAPELVLSKACEDFVVARSDLKVLQDLSTLDDVEWTLTHSLFADMGGFVIRGNTGQEPSALNKTDIETHPESVVEQMTPLQQIPGVSTTGLELGQTVPNSLPQPPAPSKLAASPHDQEPMLGTQDLFHLTAAGITWLRRSGTLPKMPSITVDGMHALDFAFPCRNVLRIIPDMKFFASDYLGICGTLKLLN